MRLRWFSYIHTEGEDRGVYITKPPSDLTDLYHGRFQEEELHV